MRVGELMTREVEMVFVDTPVALVAEKMRSRDIGMLPVCSDDRVIGTITDRDITVRATANGLHPEMVRSQDIMTPDVVSCFEDQDVVEAGKIMQDNKVRRLPVVNRDQELVGILSLGDIALGTDDLKLVGRAIQELSAPNGLEPSPG